MHVLDVTELALVAKSDALEIEVQDVGLLHLRNEYELAKVFELVVRLKVEEGEVDYRLVREKRAYLRRFMHCRS